MPDRVASHHATLSEAVERDPQSQLTGTLHTTESDLQHIIPAVAVLQQENPHGVWGRVSGHVRSVSRQGVTQ